MRKRVSSSRWKFVTRKSTPRHHRNLRRLTPSLTAPFRRRCRRCPRQRHIFERHPAEVMEREVAGRVVRDVDIRETVGVKLDALRGEIRLVWGVLGVLVTVLIAVFGFLFTD